MSNDSQVWTVLGAARSTNQVKEPVLTRECETAHLNFRTCVTPLLFQRTCVSVAVLSLALRSTKAA